MPTPAGERGGAWRRRVGRAEDERSRAAPHFLFPAARTSVSLSESRASAATVSRALAKRCVSRLEMASSSASSAAMPCTCCCRDDRSWPRSEATWARCSASCSSAALNVIGSLAETDAESGEVKGDDGMLVSRVKCCAS